MEKIILLFPGNEIPGNNIAKITGIKKVDFTLRSFPDGESYFRILSDVRGKKIIILCSLDHPDSKTTQLCLIAETLRKEGAAHVELVSPYLAYMRQDIKFNPGEGISSHFYASLLSRYFDSLITIDPHLHRIHSLSEIYTIPTTVLRSAPYISKWIKDNIENALVIGPDEESYQWAEEVANGAGVPFIVLNKERHGDKDVNVSVPDIKQYENKTPVLIDDIISSARTMANTVEHLSQYNLKTPVCIGVHGIFGGDAFELLKSTGAKIITTNTIAHPTNQIDLSELIAGSIAG